MPSIKEIVEKSHPPKEKQSFFMYYYYRRVSRYLTWLALKTPITPNQATFLEMFTGLLASVFLAFNDYRMNIIGAVLLQLWFIIDCVDGELARWYNLSSKRGGYLDGMSTNLIRVTVFLGLGFNAYMRYGSDVLFFLCVIIFSSILTYNSFLAIKYGCLTQEILKVKSFERLYEIYHPKGDKKEDYYKAGLSFNRKVSDPRADKKVESDTHVSRKQPGGLKAKIMKLAAWGYRTISTVYYFNTINFVIFFSAIIGTFKPMIYFYAFTFPILVVINLFYQYFFGFHKFMKEHSEALLEVAEQTKSKKK